MPVSFQYTNIIWILHTQIYQQGKPVLPLSFQHKYCVCVQGSVSCCSATFLEDLNLLTSDYTVFSKPKLFYKPSFPLKYFSYKSVGTLLGYFNYYKPIAWASFWDYIQHRLLRVFKNCTSFYQVSRSSLRVSGLLLHESSTSSGPTGGQSIAVYHRTSQAWNDLS